MNGIKIAVFGKARAGKDTAAEILQDLLPFEQLAFADELKRFYHEIFGHEIIGKPNRKDRGGYIWFGETMKEKDPKIWIKHLDRKLAELPANTNVLVTDMRFPAEYEYLKSMGFAMVKIEASEETRKKRMIQAGDIFDDKMLNDKSESFIDIFNADYEVPNERDKETLRSVLEVVLMMVKRGGTF